MPSHLCAHGTHALVFIATWLQDISPARITSNAMPTRGINDILVVQEWK